MLTEKQHSLLPQPKSYLWVGNLPQYLKLGGLNFYRHYSRLYKGGFRFQVFKTNFMVFNQPEYIEQILVTQRHNFVKGKVFDQLRRVYGNGILFSDGEKWQQHRRLVQPAFHQSRIDSYLKMMTEQTFTLLKGWQTGQVVDLYREMINLTFEIVIRTLFENQLGIETSTLLLKAMRTRFEEFEKRNTTLFKVPLRFSTKANLRYKKAINDMEELIYRLIAEVREQQTTGSLNHEVGCSVISMLIEAEDEKGAKLSDQQIHDEALTLFFAGHETTAIALAWSFYLLALHPKVGEKLIEEIQSVLGDKPPQISDLSKLTYTRQVLNEVLRLYPPAWVLARNARDDCQVGEYFVPAGTSVVMMPWVVQRDQSYYTEPDEFKPERWTENLLKDLPKFAYFPFGGGPRQCLGSNFALMEATVVLIMILQKFSLQLVAGQKIKPGGMFALRPKPGIRMQLSRR
jgi:cytochrome P450